MLDVIICANFGVEKLRVWDIRGGGQILESSIEIAGQWSPLQQCCTTAQPVMAVKAECSQTVWFSNYT